MQGGAWQFENDLITGRLQKYRGRLLRLLEVAHVRVDYEKLEKVEVSDITMNGDVKGIFEAFNTRYPEWAKKTAEEGEGVYDTLDPDEAKFDADAAAFTAMVLDFDRRLAAIAMQAFETIGGLEGEIKLVHGFQGLLRRPTIDAEFAPRYGEMLEHFSGELDEVKAGGADSADAPAVS